MKKINEIDNIRLKKLKENLACEKLSHLSAILKYKFGINNIAGINDEEYDIFIEDEDEGVYFQHTYCVDEIISCHAETEAYRLRRDFSMCIALETIKELEEDMLKSGCANKNIKN